MQISMWDICDGMSVAIKQHKPELIRILEEHSNFDRLIPVSFYFAFYRYMGRKHKYNLDRFIRALVIQKLLHIHTDVLLISVLCLSAELMEFCAFDKVPVASQFRRFRENYHSYHTQMFEYMVGLIESICREIDAKKSITSSTKPPASNSHSLRTIPSFSIHIF